MFLIKEAFKSLSRAKFASFITVITIIFASFLATSAVWLYFSSEKINRIVADKIEVRIFLKEKVDKEMREEFAKNVSKDKVVRDIKFVSKKEAAEEISKALGISIDEIVNNNPLPDAFVVRFKKINSDETIKAFVNKVKTEKVVDEVVYEKLLLAKLNKYLPVVKYTLFGLAFIFIIVAIYLVLVVNRMVIDQNQKNYDIMKLVGAKLSTIRTPIIINGILLSFISVILSTPIIYLFFKFAHSILTIGKFDFDLKISIIAFVIFSFILGIVGSIYSSKKISLKFKY